MAIRTSQDLVFDIDPAEVVKLLIPIIKDSLADLKRDLIYPEKYLTREEAAELLHISVPTLDKYVNECALDKYRVPESSIFRFKRSDIEGFLEKVPYKKNLRKGN